MVTWKCFLLIWCIGRKSTPWWRMTVQRQWYWGTVLLCSPGKAIPPKVWWASLQLRLCFVHLLIEKLDTFLGPVVSHYWHSILLCLFFVMENVKEEICSLSGNSLVTMSFSFSSLSLKDFVCFLIDHITWKGPINNLQFPAVWLTNLIWSRRYHSLQSLCWAWHIVLDTPRLPIE